MTIVMYDNGENEMLEKIDISDGITDESEEWSADGSADGRAESTE